MAEKSDAPEVLKPLDPRSELRAQLDAYIEQKMAQIMGGDETGIFEPFFQRKAVADAIRRLQSVAQQHKWPSYFKKHGCLACWEKDLPYASNGMCSDCYHRTLSRLQAILRDAESERPDTPPPDLDRLTTLARGALRKLSTAPLERTYLTKAERNAKRAGRIETLRVAVEQGQTASEIAEQCDPDFLKNPDAATQRIQAALYRYVPPAVRAQRQHERSTRHEEMWRKARALHERGLCWRDVARLLDPEGFAKDPKHAMTRIISGSRRVPLIRDLQDVARKAPMRK